jgi:hypothetical protein
MKTKIFVLLLLSFSCSIITAETLTFNLFDAIQRKMVKADFKGRGFAPDNTYNHYGKCIFLKIKNLTPQPLKLSLETGRKLTCVYDSIQNMMVAKSDLFELPANGISDYTIYAFCTEQHDRGPGESSIYNLDDMSQGYLKEVALLIESLGAFDDSGQQAVWVLTDNNSPSNIRGANAEKVKKLKDFVEYAIKNMKEEKSSDFIYDYSYPERNGNGFTLKGEINWEMPYSGLVSLTIYDNHNKKIKVIFDEKIYRSGFQAFKYNLENLSLNENELYWLRVDGCGKRLKEVAVKME